MAVEDYKATLVHGEVVVRGDRHRMLAERTTHCKRSKDNTSRYLEIKQEPWLKNIVRRGNRNQLAG